MGSVKQLYPIGANQWQAWTPVQRAAFNAACAVGAPTSYAVSIANAATDEAEPQVAPQEHALEEVFEPVIAPMKTKRAPAKKKGK